MATPSSEIAALVTGSSQGLGKAIALQLAKDGHSLYLNDIPSQEAQVLSVKSEIEGLYPNLKIYSALGDVSKEDDVKAIFERIEREPSLTLKVVVSNAGICTYKSFLETSLKDSERIMSINFFGTFLCYQYGAKHMIKNNIPGRLIGACSISGKQGFPLLSAYSSSKFALRGLTQSVAAELAKHGITCNAYAPGVIVSPMSEDMAKMFPTWEAFEQTVSSRTPIGRLGLPEEVASVVSFLASDAACYVNGQTISICGGRIPS